MGEGERAGWGRHMRWRRCSSTAGGPRRPHSALPARTVVSDLGQQRGRRDIGVRIREVAQQLELALLRLGLLGALSGAQLLLLRRDRKACGEGGGGGGSVERVLASSAQSVSSVGEREEKGARGASRSGLSNA